jgi:hypothetical protein
MRRFVMGTWDNMGREWGVVGNSGGYSSPVFAAAGRSVSHCFVKVGDELRHARYQGGRWEDFAGVEGGRLKSEPVLSGLEVYGVGLEVQLVRNAWRGTNGSATWQGWQSLGSPAGGILGNPAVQRSLGGRYVVVKGSDNRLYLRSSTDGGRSWGEWEQSDKLRGGQFTGDPSTFTILDSDRALELVLTGRSLENELASISRVIKSLATNGDDSHWGDWKVVGNSRGFSSPTFTRDPELDVMHCFVKVGDELRHARYDDGRWTDFASVDAGRFRGEPVVVAGPDNESIEVYGAGLDGQLARNIWHAHRKSWQGWQDLGRPEQGIVGTPAVETMDRLRFVVVKGRDDRLYLLYSDDGKSWDSWEQGDRLRQGRIKGNVSTFIIDESRRSPELVVTGRSMENEMATISLTIT